MRVREPRGAACGAPEREVNGRRAHERGAAEVNFRNARAVLSTCCIRVCLRRGVLAAPRKSARHAAHCAAGGGRTGERGPNTA